MREVNPELTTQEFFEPYDHLSDVVGREWGVEIDERIEDEMLRGRDFTGVAQAMQSAAVAIRKFEKRERVLQHDLSHYALVADERVANPKDLVPHA